MEKKLLKLKGAFLSLLMLGVSLSILQAQGQLQGTIVNQQGEELIGANIFVKSLNTGTVTDFDGRYDFSLPAGEHILSISYTGYVPQELTVQVVDGQKQEQNITMRTDNLSLDEVVVTGSFSGRTQKTSPMSITLLNANQLQRLSSNSQADILRTIPGVVAEGGGGEVASNIFIRGLPSAGQYQFTPLQVDGLPVLSTFGLNSSAHDVYFRNDIGIRNLEFTRGGSSTLFGAGSVAGIINYTSVTGSSVQDNKVQMEWADGGRAKVDFLSSGPMGDNLFYAVSGFYRYDEGPLETGLATRGYQIRANIKRLFNDGNSSFTIYGQMIDDNVQFYLPFPLANDQGQRERPLGNDGETVYTTLTSQATNYSYDTPFGRFESPIGDGVTTSGGYLLASLKHSFDNDWKLSAKVKTAKYDHWFNLFLDGDGVNNIPETQQSYLDSRGLPANAEFFYADSNEKLANSDLVFQNRILDRERPMEEVVGEFVLSKEAGNHNLSIGSFLADTKAEDNNWISNFLGDFRNAPRVLNLSYQDDQGNTVNYATSGFIGGQQTSNNYFESTKVAFFVGDEIKGERFNFDIGLRWESATGNIVRETGVGSNTFLKGTVSANDFAIALAGLYKVNSELNLYANASRGYFFPQLRSVAFSAPGQPQSYAAEAILQGEFGAKYAKNKFAGTAAAYYIALDDRRNINFINDPNNPGQVTEEVQIQSTSTVGVEVNLNYSVTPDLNLFGNLTAQKHEFTKVEGNEDQVGNKLGRQPNLMGMAGVNYDNGAFDASLSGNFLGKKYANDSNTVELDGFSIVRLDAGYKFALGKEESVRLGVSVFNLLDAAGITEGSPRQGNAQPGVISDFFVGRPILPRRIFVRAQFDF
jgi:outer membrane receptor protein involved in Fe transport